MQPLRVHLDCWPRPLPFPVTLNVWLKIAGKFLVKLEASYEASFLSQKYTCLHHSMLITHSAIWLVLLNLQMTPPHVTMSLKMQELFTCVHHASAVPLITIFTTLQWHYSWQMDVFIADVSHTKPTSVRFTWLLIRTAAKQWFVIVQFPSGVRYVNENFWKAQYTVWAH